MYKNMHYLNSLSYRNVYLFNKYYIVLDYSNLNLKLYLAGCMFMKYVQCVLHIFSMILNANDLPYTMKFSAMFNLFEVSQHIFPLNIRHSHT